MLSEITYPAGTEIGAHAHELPYFSLVLKGSYSERFGAHVRETEALDLVSLRRVPLFLGQTLYVSWGQLLKKFKEDSVGPAKADDVHVVTSRNRCF
jgi:hypothetical protein